MVSVHIHQLKKRAGHLDSRIKEASSRGRNLTFDKKELAALLWAIAKLDPAIQQPDDKC